MRYRFIDEQRKEHGVLDLCACLEVSTSAYYHWIKAEPSIRRQEDESIKPVILELHQRARGRYGHRPIYHHLQDEAIACGRDRTLRLMKELGIEGIQKRRFKPLGSQGAGFGYHPNLFKELGKPNDCDQVWVADTTYLSTEEGWMYLATVMDLCSRRILGWSLSFCNDADLVCQALQNAVLTRGKVPSGLIHHSDRGSTYSSYRYQELLKRYDMRQSMSSKGNCYDNAAMESFYGRYKSSSVRGQRFLNEAALRKNVFDYIEVFYNRFRKHAALGYRNPIQFENDQQATCTFNN